MQAGNKDTFTYHLGIPPILEWKFYSHIYIVKLILCYLQKAVYINSSIYLYFRKAEIALQSFPQKVASRFVALFINRPKRVQKLNIMNW